MDANIIGEQNHFHRSTRILTLSSSVRNFEHRSMLCRRDGNEGKEGGKGRGRGDGKKLTTAASGTTAGACRSLGSVVVKLITPRNCLN